MAVHHHPPVCYPREPAVTSSMRAVLTEQLIPDSHRWHRWEFSVEEAAAMMHCTA
jgi:hypothetical protein